MRPLVTMFLVCALAWLSAGSASAQQGQTFIQIEAVPTRDQATTRARAYAGAFPNVSSFALPNGWFAIALGPFATSVAQVEMAVLKRELLIPADSYITRRASYRQRIWPDGSEAAPEPAPSADAAPAAQPAPQPRTPDETPREARQSEARLTGTERKFLQEALQWDGYYTSAIDGAFGRGTRASMAAWQRDKGHEPTGVLTTGQRKELTDAYRALFAPFGLVERRSDEAGIDLLMPLGRVAYARTEAPFVQFDSTDDSGLRVLLISQAGDEATLFGLYDIMQTLEIVPEEGFRERKRRDFVLTGQSETLNSYTMARLTRGAVKGFTLIWGPSEDPRVIERVLNQMKASFRTIPGVVLPDTAHSGDGAEQRVDLLAGLEIRSPIFTRTGMFVTRDGAVLTAGDGLDACSRITLGGTEAADLLASDGDLGLAALVPQNGLAPQALARFQPQVPRLRTEVAVAGFAYGDVMDQPILTYGALADIRGLAGEAELQRLDLTALPGDAGGPVLDSTGAVIGMLQARRDDGARRLPETVSHAVNVAALQQFLANAGVAVTPAADLTGSALDPVDIARLAGRLTVQVNCWE